MALDTLIDDHGAYCQNDEQVSQDHVAELSGILHLDPFLLYYVCDVVVNIFVLEVLMFVNT